MWGSVNGKTVKSGLNNALEQDASSVRLQLHLRDLQQNPIKVLAVIELTSQKIPVNTPVKENLIPNLLF